ncbi:STAS domain-containing protein [Adhaeribacter terreus]|uniref:STAS domain-containing protein n=1 Tax=Adhaeribacter terreus TaxID=529703 RepID=A0ABW0EF68_9BACT
MPEIPDSLFIILAVIIIRIIIAVIKINNRKSARYIDVADTKENQVITAEEYFYKDSDGYTLEFSENEIKVIRSDKKPSILFTLKPYQLNRKDFVFLEIIDFGEGVDLERMVTPLDNIFTALEANQLYFIIFSFKGVLYFSDLAYSVSISHMQRIEDKGGRIIFCNSDLKIINVMEILGIAELVKFYPSEAEMLEKETV